MTDSDPAPPRRTPEPRRSAQHPPAARRGEPRDADGRSLDAPRRAAGEPTAGPVALRDRWWWSPTLSIVIGLVVIGYQWEPIISGSPVWGNWLVAALGAAVAVWGTVRLVRAAQER